MNQNNKGYIDFFDGHRVIGWIVSSDGSQAALIDIYIDGILVAQNICADQMRADVRDAGFGSGSHGFDINVNSHLLQERDGLWNVEVRLSGGDQAVLAQTFSVDLHHVPAVIEAAAPPAPVEVAVEPPPVVVEPRNLFKLRIEKVDSGMIRGWAIDQNDPASTFPLDILIDGVFFCQTRNNRPRADLVRKGVSAGLGGYHVDLPLKRLEAGLHTVAVRLPDGVTQESSVKNPPTPAAPIHPNLETEQAHDAPLCVIVPVYNAYEDVEICIERLAKYTPEQVEILFIDDASPDPRIAPLLMERATRKNMRILTNPENMGFTRTVNRGIGAAGNADVIFLNSDARVTPGWTTGLRVAAYSAPRVATVTAMSDRAGAFSAPNIGNDNPLPEGVSEIDFARAFRRNSLGLYPRVPTGNGFCMYVRRACIAEIGPLDEAAFPRGYGEENDFCMRAYRSGWLNLIDDRTYVYHERTKSFGGQKTDLIAAGREIIDYRYPEYKQAIGVFTQDPMIQVARYRARQAMEQCRTQASDAMRVLFVISTKTGGTPQTNKDLMEALGDTLEGWTLRCDSKALELCRLENGVSEVVQYHVLNEPVDPLTHRSSEYYAVVSEWLLSYDFDIVHIRHLSWHSIALPKLIKHHGIKVVFSFHDYYMLTPTVKMLDDASVYLGNTFTPEGRQTRQSLWPRGVQPDPVGPWLDYWRARGMQALSHCDAFITTSESSRSLILEHLPSVPAERFIVIPHGRDFSDFHTLREPLNQHGTPLRILVPGNIDIAKGLDVIYGLVEHDRAGLIEFHILGDINMVGRKPHPRIIQHGKYTRDDFAARVAKIRPHIGAVFSIWNETYCHTLTEMWSVGVPVAVFDMATVADRVRESKAGWVLDHTDIPGLYEDLLRLSFDPEEQKATNDALIDWQTGYGAANTTRIMASAYLNVYRNVLNGGGTPALDGSDQIRIGVVCSSARDFQKAPPATFTRIWERTRNGIDRKLTYIRMTPETLLANVATGALDGAILHQAAIPRTMVQPLLKAFAESGIPYLIDINSDPFNVPADQDPDGVLADYAPFQESLITRAALVSVSTMTLLGRIQRLAASITLVQDRLSDRIWRQAPVDRQSDDVIRAVYVEMDGHGADLEMILPALDALAEQYPTFRLSLVGPSAKPFLTPARERWLDILDVPARDRPYPAFVAWLREQSAQFDFAIAPLMETDANMAGSDLPILEYLALGLPTLASDVPVYRQISHDAPSVALAGNSGDGWVEALASFMAMGNRTPGTTEALWTWTIKNALLSGTLADFDAMVTSLVS